VLTLARISETSTTTGTGNFTLSGAETGARTFANEFTSLPSATFSYTIEAIDAAGAPTGAWEVGTGNINSGGALVRTTVIRSSNSGSLVNFAAGSKRVFITADDSATTSLSSAVSSQSIITSSAVSVLSSSTTSETTRLTAVSSSLVNVSSSLTNINTSLGNVSTSLGNVSTSLGNVSTSLGNVSTSLTATSSAVVSLSTSLATQSTTTSSAVSVLSSSAASETTRLTAVSTSLGNVSTSLGNVSTSLAATSSAVVSLSTSLATQSTTTSSAVLALNGVPQNVQASGYTLVLGDAGKHVAIASGTLTIPANGSVAFPIGTVVTIYNNANTTRSVAITTDTLRQGGTANTGSRTIAVYGVATILKVASTEWVISGAVT
jgi:hypothetical protein